MRAFVDCKFGQRNMPVTGKHRHNHIAWLQRCAHSFDIKCDDLVCQIANGLLRLVQGPVPDVNVVSGVNQTPQTGNGRQAGATPVNCHALSLPMCCSNVAAARPHTPPAKLSNDKSDGKSCPA